MSWVAMPVAGACNRFIRTSGTSFTPAPPARAAPPPLHARAARAYPWPSVRVAQVSELHANTAVDELVLSSCCEAMLAEETPLSDAAAMQLAYLEGQLAARPGIANAVVRAAASRSLSPPVSALVSARSLGRLQLDATT